MNRTDTDTNIWKPFWLGVNATAAAAWSAIAAFYLVLTFVGDSAVSATLSTVGLLGGVAWLVVAVRTVRQAGPSAAAGLFWFAVSATLGAALSLASAIRLDLVRRVETTEPSALIGLGVAIGCGLIWFAVSAWGAMALGSRLKERW
jgi:hypothetical protein